MVKLPESMRIAVITWLILLLSASLAWADDWQLPQLMHLLAQKKTGKATFIEKKHLKIIDQPVVSTGKLSFVAPGKLEKHTLTPKPESLVLNGSTLIIDRPGKQRMTVGLEEYPEVAAFIESIRGTLAGDLATLEKLYQIELTGSASKWQLMLLPKQERMRSIFSSIRISGVHADLKTIDIEQRDGDRSEMTITPVAD
ncbi:MAG: outer membrane lipoprotein carrier protein LolA [Gallionellaceae bacterium]|nr:outer membrane lipoprotein carrier protein LolA [Gallionellaceae bacterium]